MQAPLKKTDELCMMLPTFIQLAQETKSDTNAPQRFIQLHEKRSDAKPEETENGYKAAVIRYASFP